MHSASAISVRCSLLSFGFDSLIRPPVHDSHSAQTRPERARAATVPGQAHPEIAADNAARACLRATSRATAPTKPRPRPCICCTKDKNDKRAASTTRSLVGRYECTRAQKLSRDPSKKVTDLGADARVAGVTRAGARQKNKIDAAFRRNQRPKTTRSLSQPAFDAIANDGVSHLAAHREPTTRLRTATWRPGQLKVRATRTTADRLHTREIGGPTKPNPRLRFRIQRCHGTAVGRIRNACRRQ